LSQVTSDPVDETLRINCLVKYFDAEAGPEDACRDVNLEAAKEELITQLSLREGVYVTRVCLRPTSFFPREELLLTGR